MEKEIKVEARKQYLRYFRIWFILIGIMAVVFLALLGMNLFKGGSKERGNQQAPVERVYDYAEVLTNEEEQYLREYIAQCESKYCIDLVIVTMNEDVESYGYWDTVMMNTADDFYDENLYGYNKVHGDGALLLDNWYEDENGSQMGSWLSTCGVVQKRMGDYEIEIVLDKVYDKVEESPYEAYRSYVSTVCEIVGRGESIQIPWGIVVVLPIIIAVVYACIHLQKSPAKDTTSATTYVAGGRPVINRKEDEFIRKNVVTKRIQTNNGGGGSRGGGSHVSRSGVSHGGGGRRR